MAHPLEHQDLVLGFIPPCAGQSVLDCGCGKGIWGYILRSIKCDGTSYLVGMDLEARYLNHVRKYRIYDDLVRCDIRMIPLREGCFDLVLATEVIEHLPKTEGVLLINQLKRICRKRIVLTTPNGHYTQGPIEGVATEQHISAWSTTELRRLGFGVRGFGSRFVRPYRLRYLYGFMDNLFTPFSYRIPWIGRFLIGVLDLNHSEKLWTSE